MGEEQKDQKDPHCLYGPTQKHAFYLGVVGVVLEGTFTLLGIAAYFWLGSALLLLYGLENSIDFTSSLVVLWRFYAPGELTEEREEELKNREDRAAVAISGLILFLGCLVIPAAVGDLRAGTPSFSETDQDLEVIILLSGLSIVIFSVMTILKLYYAKLLDSESLHKDGLCSVIGIVLSTLIFVNSWVINTHPEFWQIDAYSAIVCGVVALGIGVHGIYMAIYVKKRKVFTKGFWSSQKEDVPDDLKLKEDKTKLSDVV